MKHTRAKIVKWGYKIWKLCDSSSAYTLNLDVYTGASEAKTELGLAYAVVMKLMDRYLEKNMWDGQLLYQRSPVRGAS